MGIFTLMKIFKISTTRGLSQLSQSSGSLSQLSVDVHRSGGGGAASSNESLCSELLGVLRRCFALQPRVRLTLYQVGEVENFETALQSAVLWIYVFEPPGTGSVSQRYGSGSLYHKAKMVRKPRFLLFCEFFRTFYFRIVDLCF